MNRSLAILACFITGLTTLSANADSVRLRGSSFTLEECLIHSLQGGELVFTGPGGRRMQKHLEDVVSLGFTGVEELDHAEDAMLAGEYEYAMKWFVLALAKADADLKRQWIHARLAYAHDRLGQYVQAAGHAAAVFTLEDHPAWKRLVPMSDAIS